MLAPFVRANNDGDDVGAREAVIACACGVARVGEVGYRTVGLQRITRTAQQVDDPVRGRRQLAGVSFTHCPH
ncbi:Uncharacterised protein [Mycobacterium tuberculosis]|nr:Uncharacterised protein [Mycobacterium tuberculosis]COY96051.1 Uncharacterised protein [Mycobacterium tuberculosis]